MTRVLSGAVLIVLTVGVVWFASDEVFRTVAVMLLVMAVREYVMLAKAGELDVPFWPVLVATAMTSALVGFPDGGAFVPVVLMSAFVALAFLTLASWKGGPHALSSVSASMFSLIYLGLPIGALVAIRGLSGPSGLFLLMLTVMVSDTAQYYTGRMFGRRPLAPTVSPKKTMEGAIGGFVFGTALFACAGAWWLPVMPVLLRVGLGASIVALGIAGDLFESMLKRSAGVKDSSALIPGHGGVLDRIDALLFAAPIYYIVLKYV